MIAASRSNVKFIVLDRLNPIGGSMVEGPSRLDRESFVAIHSIPLRHGMTVGELAQMFKEELSLSLDLEVIKVAGWDRLQWFDQSGLNWVNPSPIMNGLQTATFYPGVALLEFAVSVGRGTELPFEIVGAPYINERKLARKLNQMNLEGVEISEHRFTPGKSLFAGISCGGVKFRILDRQKFRPTQLGLAIGHSLFELYPKDFSLEKFNILLNHQATIDAIKTGQSFQSIVTLWNLQSEEFLLRRQKFLLY